MVLGSATLGLALHPVTPMAPVVGGLFGIAAGAAIGYGKPVWRLAAGAAASVPLLVMAPSWPAMAIVAAALALGTAVGGLRGSRGVFAVMFAAATLLLAMWCALRIAHAPQITWSRWTTDSASAAAMGIVAVLAMIPRHLRIAVDPVQAAIRGLPVTLDGEVRGLCDRSIAIWTDAKARLAETDPGKHLVRDGVLKTLGGATRSAEVDAAGTTDQQLGKRMEDLDARIAAATDAEVKTQYQSARAALDDQRRYREHIRQNRERMIARMHNHVAALEKFQLAAGGLAAVRAANAGATTAKQLDELFADVAASGEALAELELGGAPEAAPAPGVPDATPAQG